MSKYDDDDEDYQCAEGKEGTHQEKILDAVFDFCDQNNDLHAFMDDFLRENAGVFVSAVDAPPDAEHDVKWTELYNQYLVQFDRHISDFVDKHTSGKWDFLEACRAALKTESKHRWMVEMLLACSSYDDFHRMMVDEARNLGDSGTRPLPNEAK